ncbi:MAG: extracellular solute-binding protein [Chloroflexota bacterium]|nr:extracellular solute-binding protein [Chloroflexota bacterium]
MIRTLKPAVILMTLALTIAACTGGTTTPVPATGVPSVPTTSAAPGTDTPGTDAPSGSLSGDLTLWHTYSSGAGTELDALEQVLEQVRADNPELNLEVVEQPFDGVFDRYGLEVAGTGGPDLFIVPNDSLGQLSRDGTIVALDDYIGDGLSGTLELAVEGSKVDGVLYQVPESLKAVALYYNADTVATAPATTDELLTGVQNGDYTVGLFGSAGGAYHNFGWWGAFGGALMDDAGTCVADQGGVADAHAYLAELQDAGVTFYPDFADLSDAFKEGEIDMLVDGPWAAGGYAESVANLGVAPMPEGPGGPALPLTGVDGWLVNPNTEDPQLAVDVALALTSPEAQEIFANTSYHIPAAESVAIDDPISEQFAAAVESGLARPQNAELNNFWGPFGNALDLVLATGADPETAIADACAAMNEANEQ